MLLVKKLSQKKKKKKKIISKLNLNDLFADAQCYLIVAQL